MIEAAKYSAVVVLRDERSVEIRALVPDDRAAFLAAIDRSSTQSLYRRFSGCDGIFQSRKSNSS
jgi:hypothetical protein